MSQIGALGGRPRVAGRGRTLTRPDGTPRPSLVRRPATVRRRGSIVRLVPAALCVAAVALAAAESVTGGWLRPVASVAGAAAGVAAAAPRSSAGIATPSPARASASPTGVGQAGGPAAPGAAATATDGNADAAAPVASAGGAAASCADGDIPAPHARLADWATTIVDTAHVLPENYEPPDLVPVSRAEIAGWGLVRSLVVDDLADLADAARDAGNPVAVQSAYRSRSRQAEVYAGWVASSGEMLARRYSARPGHSEHELGTVLDLRATAGGAPWTGAFGSTAAGHWLAKHASEFGFVLSYPAGAEARTCYGAEPWHVRYVGRAIAAEVVASGLPLRVWLLEHPNTR